MQVDIALLDRKFQDVNPLNLGREDCEPGHTFGPNIREYYLIHYVVRGKGMFIKDGIEYPVRRGELFLIRPGEVTTYMADLEDPWEYIWIGFDGRQAERLAGLDNPVRAYGEDTFVEMMNCEEWQSTREEFVASRLFEVMAVLLSSGREPKRYEKQVADYIKANYMRQIRVEEIAGMVGLDRRYLSRIFKRYTGQTIQQYLISTRLRHAEVLLGQGYSVGQVSFMVGYEDSFHFSKMFKKEYGISPQCWQKVRCGK